MGAHSPHGSVPGPSVLQLPGLENDVLQYFLLALAVLVFLWGFERYRTSFSKREFGIAVLLSLGFATVALLPDVFLVIGSLLNVEKRFVTASILVNVSFAVLILYLLVLVRTNQVAIHGLSRGVAVQQARAEDRDAPSVFVVIPAYNEAGSIASVIESIPETVRGHAVTPLVVSDGSTDGTVGEVPDDALVVEHPINQGQGGALKTGFRIARRRGADVIVTMDADGQHHPDYLEDLVGPILDDEADYVVGSRYRGVDDSDNGVVRRAGIRVFTWLINALTKAGVTDFSNGYRAIRASSVDDLTLTEERFNAPELIIEARKNGLRIAEVPVTVQDRKSGETKKPKIGYAVGLTRTILITWIR